MRVSRCKQPGVMHMAPWDGSPSAMAAREGVAAGAAWPSGRELAVDEALEPRGAGVVTAGVVDACEGVFGDSEL